MTSSSAANSTQKPSTVKHGLTHTNEKLWLHPLDENMGAAFDGTIWTRYVPNKSDVIGEWRVLNRYYGCRVKVLNPHCGPKSTSTRTSDVVVPGSFSRRVPNSRKQMYNAGRLTLECFIGRVLENHEVCRHGVGGPNDNGYLNVAPGDGLNNIIDDLENGKSETSLTYLIQAQQRIERLIRNHTK